MQKNERILSRTQPTVKPVTVGEAPHQTKFWSISGIVEASEFEFNNALNAAPLTADDVLADKAPRQKRKYNKRQKSEKVWPTAEKQEALAAR